MLRIPIIAAPSQKLTVTLGGRQCQITISQKYDSVFVDLTADSVPVLRGAIARDRVDMIRHKYLPFSGKLVFVDTQGTDDPTWQTMGTRFKLVYLP